MKGFAQVVLLCLWLFALVAPCVITLIDNENPVLVINLNEEEQQESVKKSFAKEKIINDGHFDVSHMAQFQRVVLGDYYSVGHIEHTLEILLPPPEYIR